MEYLDTNKTALITGANSGMGKAAAAALADRGYHVLMLCRSEPRGKAALAEILAVPNRSAELLLCDLASLKSVRSVSEALKTRFQTLDLLINNAGVICLDRRKSEDGYELQFAVNHLGHFLLTHLLLPLLEASSEGRIVVYSSGAHKIGKIHFEDIDLEKHYSGIRSYAQSKLANILFTKELARRLRESGSSVTVNACHPGAVATEMGIDRDTGFGKGITKILKPFFQSPEEGADTALFLALDSQVQAISGEYFYKRKIAKISKRAQDMDTAYRLFELSREMTAE
jgi:retinol dehydrogenase 14